MKMVSTCCMMLVLTGCAGRWGQVPYVPPSKDEAHIAKIRLIGNPVGFTISQFGNKSANVDNSQVVIFKSSTDIGLPKYQNSPDRYKETYFETTLYSRVPAIIGYNFAGCNLYKKFIPKDNEIYEFRVNFKDLSGYCILYSTHMKFDQKNELYVEEPLEGIK